MNDIAYFEYATVIRPQGEEVRRDRMELGTFVKIVEKGYLNAAFHPDGRLAQSFWHRPHKEVTWTFPPIE